MNSHDHLGSRGIEVLVHVEIAIELGQKRDRVGCKMSFAGFGFPKSSLMSADKAGECMGVGQDLSEGSKKQRFLCCKGFPHVFLGALYSRRGFLRGAPFPKAAFSRAPYP